MSQDPDYQVLHNHLNQWQQEHVLRSWNELNAEQRSRLSRQLQAIDFEQLQRLFRQTEVAAPWQSEQIDPAAVLRLPASFDDWEREQKAAEIGEKALTKGEVALLMVAGGQGTRLGHEGPKGMFPIGPVSGKSLFQIHAEKVSALSRRHETPLPLFIMTSPDNDAATRQFFQEHAFFGLDPAQLTFFIQGTMPVLDQATGRLLMAGKAEIATSPNGHGGVLQAVADAGHLAELRRRGVRHLFYWQVDNPLVKVADPAFLGHHIAAGAEVSTKVVAKLDAREKLGNMVTVGRRMQMIEYSDMPQELAEQRSADGTLRIWAGNTAIHIFDVAFLERLADSAMLPYHRAVKPMPFLNDRGEWMAPAEPNAVKFEMFIFDAIPLARTALAVETARAEEFEPLKNADGPNSPTTVRQTMSNLYADWLNQAGVEVSRCANGDSAVPIEISPLYALDTEELRGRVEGIDAVRGPLLLAPEA